MTSAAAEPPGEQGFSFVLGGPLFKLMQRAHLSDEALRLVQRRLLMAFLVMWAPLAVLAAAGGVLVGPGVRVPFLEDIGIQARLLVVTPLLIIAELVVHRELRPVIAQFRVRKLVPRAQLAEFDAALADTVRWRNSVAVEAVELVLVYVLGLLFTARRYSLLGAGLWYHGKDAGGLSLAGVWLVFVSLPLLQFLLLRWYFRLFIWARFLWRVAKLDLDLDANHPDKAGGLGFLTESLIAFIPLALAHGALVAGMIADRIFFGGAKLIDFEIELLAGTVFMLLLFAGPLLIFAPRLAHTKREGLRSYGATGQVYVKAFRDKWITPKAPPPEGETLLGTGDIQSLADLSNSFSVAAEMRIVPITPRSLIYFLAAFIAPILPLVLTVTPLDKLIGQLISTVI
jgi:hypothetical protein